jgi:hypothetical protein
VLLRRVASTIWAQPISVQRISVCGGPKCAARSVSFHTRHQRVQARAGLRRAAGVTDEFSVMNTKVAVRCVGRQACKLRMI